jgi:hypothetical protein
MMEHSQIRLLNTMPTINIAESICHSRYSGKRRMLFSITGTTVIALQLMNSQHTVSFKKGVFHSQATVLHKFGMSEAAIWVII